MSKFNVLKIKVKKNGICIRIERQKYTDKFERDLSEILWLRQILVGLTDRKRKKK